MGVTSENVAEKFGVSREEQDAFAVSSHEKAARAQSQGWFKDEIVPVDVGASQVLFLSRGVGPVSKFRELALAL